MGFGRGKGFTSLVSKLGSKLSIAVGGVSVSVSAAGKLTSSVTNPTAGVSVSKSSSGKLTSSVTAVIL